MKTSENEEFPEIIWERTNEILENDPEERLTSFVANGESRDGRKWSGVWEACCGEVEIKYIEELNPYIK